jgi:hypothetical protein
MGNGAFAAAVVAGLLALGGVAALQATAPRRLVERAEARGLSHAHLAVREMG